MSKRKRDDGDSGGYKVIDVDASATIQEIASDNGLSIPRGGAFYLVRLSLIPALSNFCACCPQLENKQENVSAGKSVVAVHKKTGEQKVDAAARKAIGMGSGAVKVKANQFPEWDVFIQTTSHNRVIKGPSKFVA